jgi:hypothetical protein
MRIGKRPSTLSFPWPAGLSTIAMPDQPQVDCVSDARALKGTDLGNQPLAGGLLAADVGVTGIVDVPFAG